MTTTVFSDTLMRGQNYVRQVVGNYLEQAVPIYIDTLRYQNADLNEYYLPYPKQYLCADPYDTSQHDFPIVGAYFTNDGGYTDYNYVVGNGSVEYTLTYDTVIFTTVVTPYIGQDADNIPMYASPEREATIKIRDDITNAVRVAILGSPSFGTKSSDRPVVADLASIRVTYPEPMKANQKAAARWICSGIINVNLRVTERVAQPILGTVNKVNLNMDQLPFE